jgi:putative transposase
MVAFIDQHRDTYGVEPICAILPIAPSIYFLRKAQQQDATTRSARAQRDDELRAAIQRVWDEHEQVYGPRKVWRQLRREKIEVARCTVERLMRGLGLRGTSRGRAWKITKTLGRCRTKKKAVRRRLFPEESWWTAGGSNSRPPRCERGALPAELAAHGLDGSSAAHTLRTRESCDRKLPILTCHFPARQCDRERTGRRVHAAGWPRCRKYSTRMGSSETKTMPRATSVKFSCTTGTLPKAYPASVQMPTQMIPPVML